MLDGSGRSIDICSVPRGGGACTVDIECGRQGGLCLGGKCVCPMDWICANCSMTQTDLLYGLTCGPPDGGATCKTDRDCNHGRCVAGGGSPYCQCNPLWVCADCSLPIEAIVKNGTKCAV